MRIVCPACDATYAVPDAMLAAGTRLVRCAKCGHEWTPTEAPRRVELEVEFEPPPVPPAPPALPPPAEPPGRHEPRLKPLRPRTEAKPAEPEPEDDEAPPTRGGRARAVAAWALSILVLAGAVVAAVNWRTQVVAAWPPSERVFSAVGLR
jgi:predicted Zn finger-like uncharacterized protein